MLLSNELSNIFLTKVFSGKSCIFHLVAFLLATRLQHVGILTRFIDEVRGSLSDYIITNLIS